VSAKKADRAEQPEPKAVDRDDEASNQNCAASDSPEPPAEEVKADATGQGDTADVAEGDVDAVVVSTAAPATDATAVSDGTDDDAAIPADDRMARGRRWDGLAAEQDVEPDKTARNGVARGGGGATASPGVRLGQPATGQPTEAGVVTGAPLAEMSHQAAVAAQADAAAAAAAKDAAVTQAVEAAAAKPQTASTADAMTAIENAVANVEAVAAAETSTGADANEADTREQAQPKPQVPGPLSSGSETVAVSGPSDGMRFTVNSAAGNAAYANAAPRHEEAVLPQIVQSIRLHAVQGTTEARVQLRPEHLGALNITLRVEQNQVTATIQADVAAVRAWIESHEASLRQALSEQGLHLAKLVVHEDGQQASQDEQNGERTRHQPRRRSWRDEEQTFEVLA
jgi:flagellar hook-length control protein FliK